MPGPPRLSDALRALRARNYRLFFGGQTVSLVGTWITRIATSWLVYRLTGSVVLLGVVGFFGQLPTLLVGPFAGVLVDRWSQHRILVWTQVLSMLQSFALAALALSGVITVTQVLVLSAVQGVINAFDMPARQALVPQLVEDRRSLPNAIALNSSMVNGARIVGPAIGGAVIAAVGEGWCFFLDGVSYLAVIASLLLLRLPARAPATNGRVLADLREGVRYALGFAPIRSALLLLALVSTLGMPYTVLMPDLVAERFHGGPGALGALMTASGAGALAGAFYLATRTTVLGLGRVIVIATLLFAAGLVGLAVAPTLAGATVASMVAGGGFMVQMAGTNTILQTIVPEALRGRVMAFYTMAFLGTAPLGSLYAGFLADRIGTPTTIAMGAVACALAAIQFAFRLPALRVLVRPIYQERGILPEVPEPP